MPRSPLVNSERLRRCAGVISLLLAIISLTQLEKSNWPRRRGSVKAASPPYANLDNYVRIADRVMTFNLDPEVGVRIAVDVALDDREVTVGA